MRQNGCGKINGVTRSKSKHKTHIFSHLPGEGLQILSQRRLPPLPLPPLPLFFLLIPFLLLLRFSSCASCAPVPPLLLAAECAALDFSRGQTFRKARLFEGPTKSHSIYHFYVSISSSICLSVYLYVYESSWLASYLSTFYPPISLSTSLSLSLPIYACFICLCTYLCVNIYVYTCLLRAFWSNPCCRRFFACCLLAVVQVEWQIQASSSALRRTSTAMNIEFLVLSTEASQSSRPTGMDTYCGFSRPIWPMTFFSAIMASR